VNQCVPLDTGCRSIPYLHSTKSIRCGPDGPRFCLLGLPSQVGTSVHPTKRSPITRSRGIPRYNMYLARRPSEILSLITLNLKAFHNNTKHHMIELCHDFSMSTNILFYTIFDVRVFTLFADCMHTEQY